MPESADASRTPHALEHHDLYTALRTDGPSAVDGNDDVTSLTHTQALAFLYAEWLAAETPLSTRQAQTWPLDRHSGESRQSIARLLGVAPPSVDEYLEAATRKARLAIRFAAIIEFADTHYFDYPDGTRPIQPLLLAARSWTYETPGEPPDTPLVRHSVTYRWYADTRNSGEYHIETVDRQQTDTKAWREVTSERFSSFTAAVDGFYGATTARSLREAVIRWTLLREVCHSLRDHVDPIPVPPPTAIVDSDVDVGALLDYVDEGLITVAEAEAFATPDTTVFDDDIPLRLHAD